MGGKSSGPSQPDPVELAQAQAEANRVDQFTPFGNIVFSGPNRSTATTTLAPDQQAILDLLESGTIGLGQRAVDQIGGLPGGTFNLQGLPELPGGGDIMGARQAAEDAVFASGLRLLDPVFERQDEALRQRLSNQGIPVGSEAFAEDFQSFNTGRDQALLDLADRARLAGTAEAQNLQNLALQARQQGISERATERNQPLNEILTLLGLQQVQTPNFYAPGQVDILGANQLSQNAAIAQQQSQNDLWGGLLGLGGTLGAATILSSRQFKHDNRPVGPVLEKMRGLPVERWRYNAEVANPEQQHIGTYAEDFRKTFGVGDGVTIDAGDAIGVCMAAIKELTNEVRSLKAQLRTEAQ